MELQEVAKSGSARPDVPRSGACCSELPESLGDDLLMFGGYTEDQSLNREATNEAWVFSLAQDRWAQVACNAPDAPRVRLACGAVLVGNEVWVMGGWDPGHKRDGGSILQDIWALDLTTKSWRLVEPQGEKLPAISRFACARIGTRVFLHTHRSTDSILVLDVADPKSPVLSTVPVQASSQDGVPPSRGLQSLTAVGDQLYLYGGAPQKGPMLGDLWVLHTSCMQWELLHPKPAANGWTPHARCSHGAAALNGRIYFLAGSYYKDDGSGLQPTAELFAYDISSNQWHLLGDMEIVTGCPMGGIAQLLFLSAHCLSNA
ncbi:hypothetical protein WJX84_000947 [Apatococcus fuscideae]|uniref:Uncharacterized protein n=1 Tax=Apatococcus fuscideae TaxID=2026836 RepID=A0AAW1TK26_9CHLO